MTKIRVFTIGFTKTNAENFFTELRDAGVKRVVDVRLNNSSQLAGFAKQADLEYFLREFCGIGYVHRPDLAPTKEMLDSYKEGKDEWSRYEKKFLELITSRRVEETVPKEVIDLGCLLCSEDTPEHCHRRLVAEYLQQHWGDVEIIHLLPARREKH